MPEHTCHTQPPPPDAVELMLRRALRRTLSGLVVTGAALTTAACGPEQPEIEEQPVSCPAGTWYPVKAAGLKTAETYDYLAVRRRQDFSGGSDDAGGGWTVPLEGIEVLSESGEACATATDARCEERIAQHEAPFTPTGCEQVCYERSVVTTRGDEVERWTTPEELKGLLGPVDSFDDALLLVSAADYDIVCNDAARTAVAKVEDGYIVYATRMTASCAPIIITRYKLHVSTSGEITQLGSEELSREEGACVGRKPAGLVSRAKPAGRSAVGDALASAAHLEAASVFSFTRLMRELCAHGAPAELVARAKAARADEVRHAAVVGGLARARGGELPAVECGALHTRSLLEMTVENAVEGCIRETFGALVGAYQAEHAQDLGVRHAMVQIAKDEARHASLSHAVQRWALKQLTQTERDAVRRAQTRAIFQLAGEISTGASEADEAVQTALGLPSRELSQLLLSELVQTLWRWDEGRAPATRTQHRHVG